MDDHSNISEFLNDLSIEQLLNIGGKLGLSYPTLQKMKSLPGDMIAAWLREEDSVTTTSGHPSWTSLMTTLEKVGIASKSRKEPEGLQKWEMKLLLHPKNKAE